MPGFLSWCRQTTKRHEKENQSQESQPTTLASPFLPTPRPRALTLYSPYSSPPLLPSSSSLNFSPSALSSASPFLLLPVELRLRIYMYLLPPAPTPHPRACKRPKSPATSNARPTIHLSLCYAHADLPVTYNGNTHVKAFDNPMDLERKWRWWHSVCHRSEIREFWADDCLQGSGTACARGEGVAKREEYKVNVAWLKTCRIIYSEAIHLLYSLPTFHISESFLFASLPHLLLPQRLASITSLQLIWDLPCPPATLQTYLHINGNETNTLTSFPSLWNPLFLAEDQTSTYPSLRSLELAIRCRSFGPLEVLPTSSYAKFSSSVDGKAFLAAWLSYPDRVMRERGSGFEMSIVVPDGYFTVLAMLAGAEVVPLGRAFLKRFWRVVEEDVDVVREAANGNGDGEVKEKRRPNEDAGNKEEVEVARSKEELGYWVGEWPMSGVIDMSTLGDGY